MPIPVFTTSGQLQTGLASQRAAFVPTMGALHAGHAALIRRAREIAAENAIVVVSIFVNPTQFAPGEDFARYPRQLDKDQALCAQAGADFVFAPAVSEVYPLGPERVADGFLMPSLPAVATQPGLEDAVRPTHFAGVCKVVARLLDIVQPSHAVFGEKDYQQLRVIVEMVREQADRWPGLRIEPCATVRERDGLAMSSRNVYLSAVDRKRARALWQAIQACRQEETPRDAEGLMHAILRDEEGFDVDYAAVRDARTLTPVESFNRPCRALIAAKVGTTRLIDNMAIEPRN